MSKIKLVTDSCCDIPVEISKNLDIEVLCRFPTPQRCAAGEECFQAVRRHNSFLGLSGAGGDSEIFRVQTGLAPLPAPFQPIQETAPDIP